jgi:aldose 1-epimerase
MSVFKRDVVALCDGIARCDVVPQSGGAVAGFWWEEGGRRIDWLRPASAAAVARADAAAMACVPLVPWAGPMAGGRFRFGADEIAGAGESCGALHGHGWRRAWRVVERSPTQIAMSYRHENGGWPWAYSARGTVALADGVLTLGLSLTNESDRLMPAGLGFHPAFAAAEGARLDAAVHGVWHVGADGLPRKWSACSVAPDLAGDGVCVFTGWDGKARIVWPSSGRALALKGEWPLLSFLALDRSGGNDFSLAPVSHCADAFNLARAGAADTGLRVLAPGASRSASLRLLPARH